MPAEKPLGVAKIEMLDNLFENEPCAFIAVGMFYVVGICPSGCETEPARREGI